MNLIIYIILGIIIVVLLLVYVMILLMYLGISSGYRKAKRVNAIVKEDLGKLKLAIGSVVVGVPRYRVFHKYKVSFLLSGKDYVEVAEIKKRKLNIGDCIEVRYDFSKEGKLKLKSEALLCWSREMVVGYTIGLILGIVLCVLKAKDVI